MYLPVENFSKFFGSADMDRMLVENFRFEKEFIKQ